MKTWILVLAVSLQAATGAKAETPKIRALLVEETARPEGVPARGLTVWDSVEQAVHKLSKARLILEDTESHQTQAEAQGAPARQRLERLEAHYRGLVWPALMALNVSYVRTRTLAANVHLAVKERELYEKFEAPDRPRSADGLNPDRKFLETLRTWREDSYGFAVQAEEMLEKGLKREEAPPPDAAVAQPPDYVADLIREGEEALGLAIKSALQAARLQEEVLSHDGLYAQAIAAIGAYGGAGGDGPYGPNEHAGAVRACNEANRRYVINEYHLASRIEEVRTLGYLLDRLAKL